MKYHLSLNVPAAFILLFIAVACTGGPATTSQPESRSVSPIQAPNQSEWEMLVKEARREGKVAIYGSVIGDTRDQFIKAFQNRYGIDLEFFQGRGGEIVEKLLTERRAGLYVADVSIGGLTTFFNVTSPANISLPLEPLIVLDEVKDPAKWRSGKIPFLGKKKNVIALGALASLYITVNTGQVKESEITSYNDLLEPKWKGKIAINDPSASGRGNSWFTYMILQLYGREKGADYMRKLMAQDAVIVRDERLHVEWGARGKYPVLLGAKPTLVEPFVNAGAPIKWLKVKEPAPLSSGSLNLNAFEKAPHPNALKVFVNWVLSKEAGEILARTSGYPSERSDTSKEGFDPSLVPGPADVFEDEDYILAKGDMQKFAAEIFKDLLR